MSLIPGHTYRRKYSYPWHWAILAEIAWRLEHLPFSPAVAYRWRKAAERKGAA